MEIKMKDEVVAVGLVMVIEWKGELRRVWYREGFGWEMEGGEELKGIEEREGVREKIGDELEEYLRLVGRG